jgi:DegV family protein with EDD domain
MIKIVMDSAGDLPPEWIKKYQIEVVPINIHIGDDLYLEDVNLSKDQFYQIVEESGTIPKTSQPSPEQFKEVYRQIADPGEQILSVHITSELSGTYQSALAAAGELEGEGYQVEVFDTRAGTAIQGYMCVEARQMDRSGFRLEQIMDRLREIRDQTEIILTLDSLDFARMSGRVRALESLLVSLLRIKPVIFLKDGTLEIGRKVRSRLASLDFLVEEISRRMGSNLVNAAVLHAHDFEGAVDFAGRIKDVLNIKEFFIEEVSIGIASNLGPGTIGVIAYPASEGVGR